MITEQILKEREENLLKLAAISDVAKQLAIVSERMNMKPEQLVDIIVVLANKELEY